MKDLTKEGYNNITMLFYVILEVVIFSLLMYKFSSVSSSMMHRYRCRC